MLKSISKFVLNVFPSLAASVVGGYIVHNYINVKPLAQPPAVAASMLTTKADDAAIDAARFVMPVPVNARVSETETPAVAGDRTKSGSVASTSGSTVTGRDKPSAVYVRNANGSARAAGERLEGANHGRRSAQMSVQRERLQVSSAATATSRSGPIVMPAVDLVPDEQAGGAGVQPRVAATRDDPVRIFPSTSQMPLMKRLASFSNDVETKLVSQTLSTADDIVMAAKSVFHTVMPR